MFICRLGLHVNSLYIYRRVSTAKEENKGLDDIKNKTGITIL